MWTALKELKFAHWVFVAALLIGSFSSGLAHAATQLTATEAKEPAQQQLTAEEQKKALETLQTIAALCKGVMVSRTNEKGPIRHADLMQIKLESPVCRIFTEIHV